MMRRLFLPPSKFNDGHVRIDGPEYHHLVNVLRARPGETLVLLDNSGRAWHAKLVSMEKSAAVAQITGAAKVAAEPSVHITVAQALGRGDKFEQVVQRGTEVGASAFIPLSTERAVVRLDAHTAAEKRRRWQRIAQGAAEQSGRSKIPPVAEVTPLSKLQEDFGRSAMVLLLHPDGERLSSVLRDRSGSLSGFAALLLVGPEGGFSSIEVEQARRTGARVVSLGPHTLRTETAALVAVSQILYHVSLT
jgi:16S rRNA (uracil1498-N3)-methyltransferase